MKKKIEALQDVVCGFVVKDDGERVKIKRGPYPAMLTFCPRVNRNICLETGVKCKQLPGARRMKGLHK